MPLYNCYSHVMGAETQDELAYFPNAVGTDYLSINTTSPISGAADFRHNKADTTGGESWKYAKFSVGGGAGNAGTWGPSIFFKFKVTTGPSSGRFCAIQSFYNATSLATGVGLSNNGGNLKICMTENDYHTSSQDRIGLGWEGSTTLSTGTVYWVSYKQIPKDGSLLWGELVLYNSSGTVLESSGLRELSVAPYSIPSGWNNICFGHSTMTDGGAATGFALDYYVDDVVSGINGLYPPKSATVVKYVPNNAEGTDTAWTLGAGATEWGATSEVPTDSDTSYIVSTAASGSHQTYNVTSGLITLGAGEQVLAGTGYIYGKKDSGTTSLVASRNRIDGNTYLGTALSSASYLWVRGAFGLTQPYDWSTTDVDGMEVGVSQTLSVGSGKARVSTIVTEMAYGIPGGQDQMGWYSPTVETQSPQFSRPLLRRDSRNYKSYVTIDPWILTQAGGGSPPVFTFVQAQVIG